MNNFQWFFGVIEDVNDPLQIGRVRVRAHYHYTENKSILPTEHLPWAVVIQPPSSPRTFHGLEIGTTVFGFFADGEDAQTPMVVGKIHGTDSTIFHDMSFLVRPDVDVREDTQPNTDDGLRGMREEQYTLFKDNTEVDVPTYSSSWSEPRNPQKATYPDNKVQRTVSGHVLEIDDTEGHERLHTFHKSGSFEEYHPNGDKVVKVVGNDYEIIAGNDYCYVKGSVNLTVDNNVNMYIKKNWNVKVDGNVRFDIKGNLDVDAKRIDLN